MVIVIHRFIKKMKKALLKEIAKVEMTRKECLDMKSCAYVELLDTIKEMHINNKKQLENLKSIQTFKC